MLNDIKILIASKRAFIPLQNINFKVGYYTPKKNKLKAWGLCGLVGGCLVTPCTNWILIPFYKILNKSQFWIYEDFKLLLVVRGYFIK